ncbi:MBL fold metallo-hydrolase [Gracilibacillus sp. S3-1-1]|uniref:MBL fold metallo-hydrolase n=1 Tax=Gracilibacillus pellucidus TaxID=3095368 RepID=A0ACC6M4Y7_9BACI|nr:MBL fold metallo-hydrolase [Gracilibacillus sp. S3-1-1]MDX8045994.1 MBL fold metallo-hydrolase [Gracilibacillus sp. S3-1-1]
MRIERMSLGKLSTNCYILSRGKEAIIIDPAGESDKILTKINDLNVTPTAILLTHAHFDHIGALEDIRNYYDISVYLHELEADWLGDPSLNGSSLFGLGQVKARKAEHFLRNGEMQIGNVTLEIRHTPGHSPGGVAFIFHQGQFVVGGDSLFAGGIGRTDLPGGDSQQLQQSIKKQFYSLPKHYTVYPGHGPETTIKYEKENNPFVR